MQPRLSIAKLMTIVAVAAVNIAAVRTLWYSEPTREILIGIAPMAFALQIAAASFAFRGAGATFRLGFIVGGAVAMATFIWAMLTPEILGYDPVAGVLHRTPGSLIYEIWVGYGRSVFDRLGPLLFDPRIDHDPDGDLAIVAVRSMVLSIPQILMGLLSGLLAWGIHRAFKVKARPDGNGESLMS